ncbi:hypothetical protein EHI8A_089500 [Entamoeba histolytica HM-1:IMSS-B]|uniref:Uncharacterized protein n=6 Tax=Entamoeba histolytica TaxID=5759 RepID=C4LUK6_ENTH1|nr:hypothetical protein EHI_022930 [Entamoeba histolytica HM-1:IMSS]EMD46482.1 Hypothetical protein EHI5A_127420 [Entamoeba histolytica KU27]EMH75932.1 hypothetical protein EHI8A_089500 [Entamoeba histolytica HM-1:IMSS-B]EMS11203.1 hypothetical protein KM1_083670 [Entamoeba histolytica HM-3:IMSS]ENY62479.1 hypothetical protein EHI7A_087680 [Entamoeba histolytica HM-1:IMSS-A]GAT92303.1 hypothetical protein CL6EHI_022930 [Entamoeba histolytica]|eukprot:XP_653487.1 hypothetical protein EHI_022930 [Entamoeba histolytica HM-1:IMSS]
MRVDTLVIFPLYCMIGFVLYSVQSQHNNYGDDSHITCQQSPFYYTITGLPKQCGWNDFDYYLIITLMICDVISSILCYLVNSSLKYVLMIFGQITLFSFMYLYKHAYDAHAYCQSFILSTLKTEKKRIICKDDSFYILVGMIFFISLLLIFHSLCYIIKDPNGITMGELNFGTSIKEQSTDKYARDVRVAEKPKTIKEKCD